MEAGTAIPAERPQPRAALGGRVTRVVGQALGTWRGKVGLGLTVLVCAVAVLGPLVADSPLEIVGAPFEPPGGAGVTIGAV